MFRSRDPCSQSGRSSTRPLHCLNTCSPRFHVDIDFSQSSSPATCQKNSFGQQQQQGTSANPSQTRSKSRSRCDVISLVRLRRRHQNSQQSVVCAPWRVAFELSPRWRRRENNSHFRNFGWQHYGETYSDNRLASQPCVLSSNLVQ